MAICTRCSFKIADISLTKSSVGMTHRNYHCLPFTVQIEKKQAMVSFSMCVSKQREKRRQADYSACFSVLWYQFADCRALNRFEWNIYLFQLKKINTFTIQCNHDKNEKLVASSTIFVYVSDVWCNLLTARGTHVKMIFVYGEFKWRCHLVNLLRCN